jgi:haloacetate dehalogenase
MSDLADLYPDYASRWIATAAGRIFARAGGEGPPLLLLHGYPQTNVMWQIEVMEALGHARFRLAGHDRGGRVAYRLALDHPGRVDQLAVLDIVPTWTMWHKLDARLAYRAWHWMFLALPAPFPETMIGKEALFYFDSRAAAGTKGKSLAAFDPRALAHYHAFFDDPVRIHATCEDYRAGRTTDLAHDEASRANGEKIACPLLAIWGAAGGIPAETEGPLATWREWARDVRGFALDCGHYLAEEAPEATASALIEFFTAG